MVLAETRRAAESVIDAFRGLNAHILVQEYIAEAKGCDIRCTVVGNEVVAAIERRAKGDFRSNLHRGGMATVAQISDEGGPLPSRQRKLSAGRRRCRYLRAARGPLVMEVNASPGLEGVETTTGVDVAGKMIAGSSAGRRRILFENRRLTAGCKTAMVCGAFCVSYGVVFPL